MVPAQPPLIIGGVAPAGPRKWYPPPPPLTLSGEAPITAPHQNSTFSAQRFTIQSEIEV